MNNKYAKVFTTFIIIIHLIYSNYIWADPLLFRKDTLAKKTELGSSKFAGSIRPLAVIANLFCETAPEIDDLAVIRASLAGIIGDDKAGNLTFVYNNAIKEAFIYDREEIIHIYLGEKTLIQRSVIGHEEVGSIKIDIYRYDTETEGLINGIENKIVLAGRQEIGPEETDRIVRKHIAGILRNAGIGEEKIGDKSLGELTALLSDEYIDANGGSSLRAYLAKLLEIASGAGGQVTEVQRTSPGKALGPEIPFLPVDLLLTVLIGLIFTCFIWHFMGPLNILWGNNWETYKMLLYLLISFISPWLSHEFLGHYLLGKAAAKYLKKKKAYPEVKIKFHWLWTEVVPEMKPDSMSPEQRGQLKSFEKVVAGLGPGLNLMIFVSACALLVLANTVPFIDLILCYIIISNFSALFISMTPVGSVKLPAIGRFISHARWKTGRQSDGGIIFGRELLTEKLLKEEIKNILRYDMESNLLQNITRGGLFGRLNRKYDFLNYGRRERDFYDTALDEMIGSGEVIMLYDTQSLVLSDDVGILLDKERIELLNHTIDGRKQEGSMYFLSSERTRLVEEKSVIPVVTFILKKDISVAERRQRKRASKGAIGEIEKGVRRIYFTPQEYDKWQKEIVSIGTGERVLRIYRRLTGSIGTKKTDLGKIVEYCIANNKLEEFLEMLDVILIFNSLPEELKNKFGSLGSVSVLFLWSLLPEGERTGATQEQNELIARLNKLREFEFEIDNRLDFSLYFQFIDQLTRDEPRVSIFLFCLKFKELLTAENRERNGRKKMKLLQDEILYIFRPLFGKHFCVDLTNDVIDSMFSTVLPSVYEKIKKQRDEYLEGLESDLCRDFGCGKRIDLLKKKIEERIAYNLREHRNIKIEVTVRKKGVWSTYDKMVRYSKIRRFIERKEETRKTVEVDDIPDLLAFRVVVSGVEGVSVSEEDKTDICYRIRDIFKIVRFMNYVEERSDDFIRSPKASGYQSLNTVWMCGGKMFEIQIRTDTMNEVAEHGLARHGLYKVRSTRGEDFITTEESIVVACREKGESKYILARLPNDATFLDLLSHPKINKADRKVSGNRGKAREILSYRAILKPGDIVEFELRKRRDKAISEASASGCKLYRSRLFTKTLDPQDKWREGLSIISQKLNMQEEFSEVGRQQHIDINLIEKLQKKCKGKKIDLTGLCRAAIDYAFTTRLARMEFEEEGKIEPCLPGVEELLSAVHYGLIEPDKIIPYIRTEGDAETGEQGQFESLRLKPNLRNSADEEVCGQEIIYNAGGGEVLEGSENIRDYLFREGRKHPNWQEGLDLFLDDRLNEGMLLQLLSESLSFIEGSARDNVGIKTEVRRRLSIGIVDKSPSLFVDCRGNGFIGINKIILDIINKDESPEGVISKILLIVGLNHELLHEAGFNSEDFVLGSGLELCLKLADKYAKEDYSKVRILCELNRLLLDFVEEDSIFIRRITISHLAELLADTARVFGSVKDREFLEMRLRRVLGRLEKGKKIELTERQMNRVLWLIDRSGDAGLVGEIAELVDLVIPLSGYTGDAGSLIMAVEGVILSFIHETEEARKAGYKERAKELIDSGKGEVIKVKRTLRELRFEGTVPQKVKDALNYAYYGFKAPEPRNLKQKISYILIDEYRADIYGKMLKDIETSWNVRFIRDISEIPSGEGVSTEDIVVLLDPEDADNPKWQGQGFKCFLPLPYMKVSFILAAELARTNDREHVYRFLSNFYGDWLNLGKYITVDELESWLKNPLLLKDKIGSKIQELRFIRIAAEQLDASA